VAKSRIEREKEARRQRTRSSVRDEALARARRRQRLVGIGVVVGVVVFAVAVIAFATSEDDDARTATGDSSTTLTSVVEPAGASTTVNTNPPAELPELQPGAVLTGETPCPEPDGSSPRTTGFAGPPPLCIDPAKSYEFTIRTTKGDITGLLFADSAPQTTNNFVVLARYHYYDGAPVTRVVPRGWFEVADTIVNPDGSTAPGYTIPGEVPEGGTVATALMVAAVPGPGGESAGSFLIGTADQVVNVPPEATAFGLVTDDRVDRSAPPDEQPRVSSLIDSTGTASGMPAEVVTITGIDITELEA
jgi:cyclophilin family peptidyl-prolyl cis-trans isomerase